LLTFLVSDVTAYRMKMEGAARGYEVFENQEEDRRKVVLIP
jgi:hypothetical protein